MENGLILNEFSRFFQIIQNKSLTIDQVITAVFCKARKNFFAIIQSGREQLTSAVRRELLQYYCGK